ncbi:MAG: methylated-DNA--[protein]-cysteine S-methyltransferase [Candidatus Aminicenantales bacterium]
MKIEQPCYELISTAFETMGIVWWNTASGPRVRQTFLSRGRIPAGKELLRIYPSARRFSCPAIAGLGRGLQRFLEGRAVVFDLDLVALELCRPFQQRVLLAEYGIPRGSVSTYGRIAEHLGVAGGGRAVGRALAENPFPIIIPCHRAVRADGGIGGYQGGSAMKRALLEMEGVEFTDKGKAAMTTVFY